jgi:hypothetical protein
MANGDKAFYRSEGTGDVAAQTSEGHWVIDGRTDKFEGAKGKGTYNGRVGAGGLRTYDSEGNRAYGSRLFIAGALLEGYTHQNIAGF